MSNKESILILVCGTSILTIGALVVFLTDWDPYVKIGVVFAVIVNMWMLLTIIQDRNNANRN